MMLIICVNPSTGVVVKKVFKFCFFRFFAVIAADCLFAITLLLGIHGLIDSYELKLLFPYFFNLSVFFNLIYNHFSVIVKF